MHRSCLLARRLFSRLGGLFLFSCALTAAAVAAEQFPGLDAKWRHVRSPHFEIYSRTSEGFARKLLTELETMRACFLDLLQLPDRAGAEVTVYAFRSGSHFKAYVSDSFGDTDNLVGEYRPTFDRDVILLPTDEPSQMTRWVINANLAKSLVNSQAPARPSWLHEGLSMFFGNFYSSGDHYVIGDADSLRRRLVGDNPTMNVAALFNVEEGRAAPMPDRDAREAAQDTSNLFHARSWVLLHYWYCGQSEVPAGEVSKFIRFALAQGNSADPDRMRAKFQEVFKIDYEEMNRRVGRYMRAQRFHSRNLTVPAVPAATAYVSRQVDETEMRERLAELRLRTRRDSLGRLVLLEALKGPRAARAAEALGNDAAADADDRRVQDYWEQAIAGGSSNAAVVSYVTRMEYARWFSHYDYYLRLPPEKTEHLRDLLARCQTLFPDRPVYSEMAVWVEAAAQQPSVRHVNQLQAKLPPDALTANALLAVALVRARLGDRDSALELLGKIDALQPTAVESAFARQVRRILTNASAQAESDETPPQ